MKITMVTIGSTGDVKPYIILGNELQKRNHQVMVAAFPQFSRMVEDAGLHFFPLSGDAESFISSIMAPGVNAVTYLPHIGKSLRNIAPSLIQDLELSCKNADFMICNYFGTVYYSIAEKLQIPCIQTHFFPMDPTGCIPISSVRNQHLGTLLNKASYKAGYYLIGLIENRLLGDWRKKNNLENRRPSFHPDYRVKNHPIPVIYAISPAVFPRPKEWDSTISMTGFWLEEHPCEWLPPQSLTDFIKNGSPPVYIGFGSMNTGDAEHLWDIIHQSLQQTGLRAVISSGWSEKHLSSDSNIYCDRFIPHNWLFPHVQAVIHHGGAGTTAAGLRFGKPTLILPFAGDQPFWGTQIYRIGCGPKPIPRKSITAEKMSKGLVDLTTCELYKRNARQISGILAEEHGALAAADLIEKKMVEW